MVLGMFRVMFMGPRRMRESLGHDTRDSALRFLARHAASIVGDVRIISASGVVERFPARTDAAFYESHMTIATLCAPKEEAVPIDRFHANTIMRLLGAANGGACATLRALARRYQVAERNADDLTVRSRLRELAERVLV
jgi:hypothetical protein